MSVTNKKTVMKKIILAVTLLTLGAVGMQSAKAGGIHFGFSIGLPLPPLPVIVAPAPRVVYQAPDYCPPPVVYRAPAYCPPAPPVVIYREPAYCAPAPVIGFRFGHGDRWGHERWEHHGSHHGRW